jgi:hypothetical protein
LLPALGAFLLAPVPLLDAGPVVFVATGGSNVGLVLQTDAAGLFLVAVLFCGGELDYVFHGWVQS